MKDIRVGDRVILNDPYIGLNQVEGTVTFIFKDDTNVIMKPDHGQLSEVWEWAEYGGMAVSKEFLTILGEEGSSIEEL